MKERKKERKMASGLTPWTPCISYTTKYELTLFLLLLGSPTVGKTSLCQMASSNGTLFPKKYNMVSRLTRHGTARHGLCSVSLCACLRSRNKEEGTRPDETKDRCLSRQIRSWTKPVHRSLKSLYPFQRISTAVLERVASTTLQK